MAASIAKIKIGVAQTDYNGISLLCSNVIAGMFANPGNFPSPSPILPTLSAALAVLNAAIATWGPVGARGSHADWVALQAASHAVYISLVQEAAYVQNVTDPTQPYAVQAAFITSSGFAVKNLPTPQGLLGVPQNFHQVFNNSIDIHTPWLDWKKPLGLTSVNNVKSYEIFRASTPPIPSLSIATVTETRFIDTDPVLKGHAWLYWVCGVNDLGRGAFTADLPVSVPY